MVPRDDQERPGATNDLEDGEGILQGDLMGAVVGCLQARQIPFAVAPEGDYLGILLGIRGMTHDATITVDGESRSIYFEATNATANHFQDHLLPILTFAARVNWDLRSGAFIVDPQDGEVRFRASLLVGEGVPSPQLVNAMLSDALGTINSYALGFSAVGRGADPDEMIGFCQAFDEESEEEDDGDIEDDDEYNDDEDEYEDGDDEDDEDEIDDGPDPEATDDDEDERVFTMEEIIAALEADVAAAENPLAPDSDRGTDPTNSDTTPPGQHPPDPDHRRDR